MQKYEKPKNKAAKTGNITVERQKSFDDPKTQPEKPKVIKNQKPQSEEIKNSAQTDKKQVEEPKKISEVDKFLMSIKMEKYSQLFLDNGIEDLEILEELSEIHLEQLGLPLGHRIKILKKIRENLKGSQATSPVKQEIKPQNSPIRSQDYKAKATYNKPSAFMPTEDLYRQENEIEVQTDSNISQNLYVMHPRVTKHPIQISKPPGGNKATVGKNMSIYQPEIIEKEEKETQEMTIKLSDFLQKEPENNTTVQPTEIKWDSFQSYVPYQPSQEIQASQLTTNSKGRPNSATKHKQLNKSEVQESINGWGD